MRTVDAMRVHIERLITELRATRFPDADDLHFRGPD
jgi:hypothetical protein